MTLPMLLKRFSRHPISSPPLTDVAKQAVVVLGMHRSGTSALSGALQRLGVYFGESPELFPPDQWNQAGYFEYGAIVKLNDKLLASVDAGWDAPPTRQARRLLANPRHPLHEEARELIGQLAGKAHQFGCQWGFKDPRTTLTWPFWKHVLPEARLVICLRAADEVAASLKARHSVTTQFGRRLTEQYYAALLSAAQGRAVHFVYYPDLVSHRQPALAGVAEWLRLDLDPTALANAARSIRPDLAHHSSAGQPSSEPAPHSPLFTELLARYGCQAPRPEHVPALSADDANSPGTANPDAEPSLDQADADTLLQHGVKLWLSGNADRALTYLLAAMEKDSRSARITRQLCEFLLIRLNSLCSKPEALDLRKKALTAFLCLQPEHAWAITLLSRLAVSPCDEATLKFIQLRFERLNESTKEAVRSALAKPDFPLIPPEAQHYLSGLRQ